MKRTQIQVIYGEIKMRFQNKKEKQGFSWFQQGKDLEIY